MDVWEVFWMQTVVFGMDGQWDSTVQHRETCLGHFVVHQNLKHCKSTYNNNKRLFNVNSPS